MRQKIIISVILLFLVIPGIVLADTLTYQKTQITTGGKDVTPAWSPDGEKIVFASNNGTTETPNYDIYVVNKNGTGRTQLTLSGLNEKYPSWNPAGTKIAYVVFDPNGSAWPFGGYFLYTMDADGSNKTILPLPPRQDPDYQEPDEECWINDIMLTAWSPDGTKIAFVSFGPEGGAMKIYQYNLTNNTVIEITPSGEANPAGTIYKISWCAATNLIAYDRWPIGVHTFTPGLSDLHVLSIPAQQQFETPSMPGWNPSGTKVAYVRNPYEGSFIGIFDLASETSVVEASSSNFKWPVWSPDGKTIAVIEGDFNSEGNIWILTLPAAQQPLYGSFTGTGIWQWGGSGWTQLTPDNPESIVAAGTNLYGKFANGIWQWTGSGWTKLTPDRPASMVASGSNLYGNFTGNGIWQWNGSGWTQLTADNPETMVAAGTNLYGKFANGIWQWTGSGWTKLTPDRPAEMVAAGTNLYGNFTGNGIWQWNGSGWTQLTPDIPEAMAAAGSNLYGKFGNGIWQWNGSGWTKLTPDRPASMAAAGNNLYGTFTGNGIWQWNGTNWTQLTPDNPVMMAVGE